MVKSMDPNLLLCGLNVSAWEQWGHPRVSKRNGQPQREGEREREGERVRERER
jgi:hypothetical protein